MSNSHQPPVHPAAQGFVPVCAIGASAGGVGALQTLFRLLPDDLGFAYVVVVHLSPDHPSAMHEILGSCTKMPVHQVRDGPKLRPNCVFVIAPDRELVIEGDEVRSRPFTDPRGRRAPIDMFFRSVAAGRGDGIAVVLTGSGADGAFGVRAIKEAGGIVMVQEPAEAGFPSMPQNAIATGVADVVAPLARLAERIAEAAHSKEAVRSLDEDGAANDVRRIVAFLRTRTGHDFSGYKRSTVLRRIQRRMQVCQIIGLADYLHYLRANPEESKSLLSDLLISVTMFFRDPETFVALSHRVIQPLLEARSTGEAEGEIRAWVVGCATGEEAYSLAMLLLEEAERLKLNVPIQIFATDLDEGALATAREGRYPRSIEADVSVERLKRFFVDEGTHYRIERQVRDLILFAAHSVVREPPFMRLDLVSCRNVLIYLERALQNHVNSIFRYGLKDDGYLFLGTAETADTSDNLFAVVDRDARIYRALPARPEFVPTLTVPGPWNASRPALTESRLTASRLAAGEVLGESHTAALEVSAPPSALVDAEQSVLHLSPSAGRFILLSAGPLSGRLPSIVRPELRLDLKLSLERAFESQRPMITRPIDVAMEGETRRVLLHIAPLPSAEGVAPRAIVYFLDSGPSPSEGVQQSAPPPDELQHLHSELKVAQEAELAGRIRHESVVQELRASNEELQSLNEEYRSTAEELETSKEELQSINEELQTVNAELKSKLGIISAAHNDLQNLTASSEIGTLFLDLDLRIRMFTPRVAELINIAEPDVGRPITNFTHQLDYDGIAADVQRVLRDLTPIAREVRTTDERWFLIRIRPYRTTDEKVEGAVATFDDVTDRKEAAEALADELRNTAVLQKLGARLVTEDNIQTIYEDILTAAIEITRAKAGTVQILDDDTEQLIVLATRGFSKRTEAYFRRVDASSKTSCGQALRSGQRAFMDFDPASTDFEARLHVEDGALSAQSSILVSRSGRPIGMVSTHWGELGRRPSERETRFLDLLVRQATDLIEQRRAEAALRESEWRLREREADLARVQRIGGVGGLNIDIAAGMISQRSPEYLRLHGLRPEAVQEAHADWLARIHPDDAARAEQTLFAALEGDATSYESEYRIIRPSDHALRWIAARADIERDADGKALRLVGAHIDITDQKTVQEALRESEERLRGLGEASHDILWIRDAETLAWTYLTPAFEKIYGLTRAEVLRGDNFQNWLDLLVPDDRDRARAMIDRLLAGEHVVFQYRVRRPRDGEIRWLRDTDFPILDEHGRVTSFGGIGQDVTSLKAAEESLRTSEERLRSATEVAKFALWDWNIATGELAWSDEHFRMQGYGVGEVAPSYDAWVARIHPDDRAEAEAKLARARDSKTEYVHEFRSLHPDGSVHWLSGRGRFFYSEAGEPVRMIGAMLETTERRKLEERQQVLIGELQHRTRNLIGVVRSMADKTARASSDLEDFRARFRDRLDALSRVQGLLSRLSDRDRVTFDDLIRTELSALDGNAEKVVLEGPSGIRLRSSTVQTLSLAIHELATNAVKYGALRQASGQLTIRWSLEPSIDDGRPWLHIDWRETGVKMPSAGSPPSGFGQGRELIEQALPYQLSARTSYTLGPDGVHCTITIPISKTMETGEND
ncbi:PAS domain S-box-containing protein [Sphingomonas zeicaulis]|uniref:PAS domain-containing protein n=1 Tax=Sphingomonas zeicaulis TaxID=1632740 RepID=UPI003D1A4A52